MKTYRTYSSEETKKIGEKLAKSMKPQKGARVLALRGNLGAGKTTFVQGFSKGLGIKRRTPSPTFVIMRRHRVPGRRSAVGSRGAKNFSDLFHVDAYRLKKGGDLKVLDFDKVLEDPRNIVLIEWADRTKDILPKDVLWLDFGHGKKENERRIVVRGK